LIYKSFDDEFDVSMKQISFQYIVFMAEKLQFMIVAGKVLSSE